MGTGLTLMPEKKIKKQTEGNAGDLQAEILYKDPSFRFKKDRRKNYIQEVVEITFGQKLYFYNFKGIFIHREGQHKHQTVL